MIEKADGSLDSRAAAESVVEAISREFVLDGQRVFIGVSIGTTVYPDHADTVESLMRHADVAMYQAKEEGKNKVTFFSSELAEDLERRVKAYWVNCEQRLIVMNWRSFISLSSVFMKIELTVVRHSFGGPSEMVRSFLRLNLFRWRKILG